MTDKDNAGPQRPQQAQQDSNKARPAEVKPTVPEVEVLSQLRSRQQRPRVPDTAAAGSPMTVTVHPISGNPFNVSVGRRDSVEELKKAVAKRLKVLKDRICLLYRERQLSEGTLEENFLVDGSKITLLPRAETGLLAQKPEQSVMQALESLNELQVVDFLSGKAPLNLTMRLGDHMMLIQLQLSTVHNCSAAKRARTAAAAAASAANPRPAASSVYRANRLDERALVEASKNLTKTLKQLSSEVITNKNADETSSVSAPTSPSSRAPAPSSPSAPGSPPLPTNRKRPASRSTAASSGAIIESMHHHGKGVYSGTFSGTLNPALQDRNGQPKRDITTIIHILNDLLCAQYKTYTAKHSSSSSAAATARTARASSEPAPSSSGFTAPPSSPEAGMQPPGSIPNPMEITREKVEQLKKAMEERRAIKRARQAAKEAAAAAGAAAAAAASYSTSWSVKASSDDGLNVSSAASSADGGDVEDGAATAGADLFGQDQPEPVPA